MLKGLLEKNTCASCKICCGFDNTDLWELPIMNSKTVKRLLEFKPDTAFKKQGGGFVTDVGELDDNELFLCPALDPKKGCILGEDKPFDCLIWPFRIMETEDKRFRMITVSPICHEIYNRQLSQLKEFVDVNLKEKIFEYADKHPEIIKKYRSDCPILILIKS